MTTEKTMFGPLLTLAVQNSLRAALGIGTSAIECSLDLGRSTTTVEVDATGWTWRDQRFPHIENCKDRTVYFWDGESFQSAACFSGSLVKLVPTNWGPPTFEIDGIKMLPTAHVSPYVDAERKVGLIDPRGKIILDTCGGLGYFAAWCLQGQAARIISFEKNPDVIWLRGLNPWSPATGGPLELTEGDITEQITTIEDQCVDAILHDPPRFGSAGKLYSQVFYNQLARVLRPKGKLFHYTGTPNKLTSGRDVPNEISKRLRAAGFAVQLNGDGLLAVKA